MKCKRRRKCLHCREFFQPDRRNLWHQRYCSKPSCRQASKAASQRPGLAKPQNRDYFRGPAHVERVRAWRAAHPGYWHRSGRQSCPALQQDSLAQVAETQKESTTLADRALRGLRCATPCSTWAYCQFDGQCATRGYAACGIASSMPSRRLCRVERAVACPAACCNAIARHSLVSATGP
jgi:hypothetical protein